MPDDSHPYISSEELAAARRRAGEESKPTREPAADKPRTTQEPKDEAATEPAEDVTPRSQPEPAAETPRQPKKRRPWRRSIRWVAALAVAALLVWIGVEQLTLGNGGHGKGLTQTTDQPSGTSTVDPQSVKIAVEYERLVVGGHVRKGCALAGDPRSCEQSWLGSGGHKFTQLPRAIQSAPVAGQASDPSDVTGGKTAPAATVVLVTYRHTGAPNVQRWAVLVRNSDHKVIGDQSIGSAQSGMTLAQVGAQIQEASQG